MPFLPTVSFWWLQHHTATRQHLEKELTSPIPTTQRSQTAQISAENRLVVPTMMLDAPINEGKTLHTLTKGLWRLPYTSNPAAGGNMVIVGHRFTYTNPRGIFYFLNKVMVGDHIGVFWQGKRYLYDVSKVEVVPPTDLAVEAPTSQPELTLYTCTPLWWPKDRLVVVASQERL